MTKYQYIRSPEPKIPSNTKTPRGDSNLFDHLTSPRKKGMMTRKKQKINTVRRVKGAYTRTNLVVSHIIAVIVVGICNVNRSSIIQPL
jgi:hypothetical protein